MKMPSSTDPYKITGNPQFFKARMALPIFSARKKLVNHIRDNPICILVGETGSGKTTQLIQYLHESGIGGNKGIACTQPRRVAAINVAQRVSKEQGVVCGQEVGYCVRFQDCTSRKTKIKYLTDGMMLKEAIGDPLLKQYSVIILDEAHERTIHTDVLFSIVKGIQKERDDLRIVVMSATLDASKFSDYFGNCSVLYVAGRQFPVDIMYTEIPESDYIDAVAIAALQIHLDEDPGDILCFLTGQDEIDSMQMLLEEKALILPESAMKMLVLPIYAKLPSEEQMKVFQSAPPGTRKIILSTNIAETSITIDGIHYVIDCGLVKSRSYNPKSMIETLKVMPISKAQARQRTGRAGRVTSGICFRLYPETTFNEMENTTKPEIIRCDLVATCLQLLALGVKNLLEFDFMDKPEKSSIVEAMTRLLNLGALDKKGKINDLGKQMSRFPVNPPLAKVLIIASQLGCLEEVLSVVSLVEVPSIFFTPRNKQDQILEQKRKFMSNEGDHITLLNVYKGYRSQNGNAGWCRDNFVNAKSMKTVMQTRRQLKNHCEVMGLTIESCGLDTSLIRKALVAGYFTNIATLQEDGSYKTSVNNERVAIHPSSVLIGKKMKNVIYGEIVKTTKSYLRNVSVIEPSWAEDFSFGYYKKSN